MKVSRRKLIATVLNDQVKQAWNDPKGTGDLPRYAGGRLHHERRGNRTQKSIHTYQNLVIKGRRETWWLLEGALVKA